ncbi:MAG: hypothetical protein ACRDG3_08360 [Tepidiformaceae bacterium]
MTQLQDDKSKPVRLPHRRQRPQDTTTLEPADSAGPDPRVLARVAPEAAHAQSQPLAAEVQLPTRGRGRGLTPFPAPEDVPCAETPAPVPPGDSASTKVNGEAAAAPVRNDVVFPPPSASSLFTIPLRGQSSASDVRAERLVRQVRGELDQLRQTLDELSSDHGGMLHLDPATVAANPDAALSLPPAVLVRTIVAAHACSMESEMRRKRQAKRLAKLQSRLSKYAIEDAETRSRLGTLEEVITALHANLEDLRLERGQPRIVTSAGLPALPQASLAAQHHSSTAEFAPPAEEPFAGSDDNA